MEGREESNTDIVRYYTSSITIHIIGNKPSFVIMHVDTCIRVHVIMILAFEVTFDIPK